MKKCLTFILLLVFSLLSPAAVKGEDTVWFLWENQEEETAPGEKASLLLSLEGDYTENISTFRARITFDSSCLEFRGLQAEGETEDSEYSFSEKEGSVILIFLSDQGGISVDGTKKELCSLNFLVRNTTEDGQIPVRIEIDGVGTDQLQELPPPEITGAQIGVVTPDYSLQALQPDTGTLQPDFRPDILNYTMEVPYSIDRITFYAKAMREDATVKVSRKTLEKAGETTAIKITVRSPDGTTQKTYEVMVYRQERPDSLASVSGGKTSSAAYKKGSSSSSKSAGNQKGESKETSSREKGSSTSQEEIDSQEEGQIHTHMIAKEDRTGAFWLTMGLCVAVAAAVLLIPYVIRKKKDTKKEDKEETK